MNTKDIGLYENGNGGELAILSSNINLAEQLCQSVYLYLFGGNTEASTRGDEATGQLRHDWWANSLIFGNNKSKQFNSDTERALANNVLNSTGRINIINAVKTDLQFLSSIATVIVDATILAANKIMISVTLTLPTTHVTTLLQVIWDNVKGELIIDKKI